MPNDPMRFGDDHTYLAEFLDEVFVRCPRCSTAGIVEATVPYSQSTPRFTCAGCALRLEGRHSRWFGTRSGGAHCRCGRCGRELSRQIVGDQNASNEVDLRCSECDSLTSARVQWSHSRPGQPHEPAFGLELLLQAPCKGHTLWAYNPRHLEFIAEYVAATIRERTPNFNATLASRLPDWIKVAKNRPAVLRAVRQIESSALS